MSKFQNFLLVEDQRNFDDRHWLERFLKRAIGPETQVMCGHHIIYTEGDVPTEIPSEDTLLFNPDLMGAVFGKERAKAIMLTLTMRPPAIRGRVMGDFLDLLDKEEAEKTREVPAF
jgi:hypothetical protein